MFRLFVEFFLYKEVTMSDKEAKGKVYDPEIDILVPLSWWDYLECLAMAGLFSGFYFPTAWLLLDMLFFGRDDPGRLYNLSSEAMMALRICGYGFVLCFIFLVCGAVRRKRRLQQQ